MVTLEHRHIRLTSPPGEDVLFFRRMIKTEQLGRMFEMEVECISNDHHIALKDVLGKPMTVEIDLAEGIRYFHGFVSKFSYLGHFEGFAHYKATLRPWLWFLTRKQDSRIFQEKTVPDILEEVFKEINGFSEFERKLYGNYRTWEYCVQYRETDFNFVSRLMEQEGIYYYFKHEKDEHTVVLSDGYASHGPYPGFDKLLYYPPEEEYRRKEDHIWEWRIAEEVQSGRVVLDDFDFIKPSADLRTTSAISARQHPYADMEVFDYPGLYTETDDGDTYARVRMDEHNAQYERLHGEGNARGLAVGHLFDLEALSAPDWREEQNREYLITAATHVLRLEDSFEEGGQKDSYVCRFEAIHSQVDFRPPRVTPKPIVPGPQTAFVVGKEGEEIWTDKYGRVKVHFHWDRYGSYDDQASCWIRVAQIWADKKWGGMFIPRIGQEVIVDFLEGDPDRPIITGRVYNNQAMPPYGLPDNQTISTIKTLSSKGGGNFNELRFEDKKGEEQVFVHAAKNQDIRVKNDRFETIEHDRHLMVQNDKFEKVDHDRSEVVTNDHMEEIGNDRHLKVTSKQAIEVGASYSLTVTGDVIEVFKSGHSEQTTNDYYLKAMKVVIEGMTNLTLKVGGSYVVISPAGVDIQGPMVKINSGGAPGVGQALSAVLPAAPEEAFGADTADPGEMVKIKEEQRKTKSGKYGSTPAKLHKAPQNQEEKEKKPSWIEIELVDEDDNPVPGEGYKITLPDGTTVASGTLDDKGFARVDGIEPGSCQITFPKLDKDTWGKA